jgi:hypothetical protein
VVDGLVGCLVIPFEEVKDPLLVVPDAIEEIRDETHDEEDQAQ